MEAALRRIGDLAPAVEGTTDPDDPAFGQVFVGIEGLARLWGTEPALVDRAIALVAPILPGRPRAGVGNTRFGAQVAAVVGGTPGATPGQRYAAGERHARGAVPRAPRRSSGASRAGDRVVEAAFLAPLPIGLLPADADSRERFRLFGLTRIGELAALDRSAVVARFGAPGGDLHDLARGLDGRPLRPRRPVERLRAEVELEPPVDTLEPLRFVLRHLCGALCEQLAARGAGAARATLDVVPERGEPVRYEQALPEPAAAAELLERLLMARLEAAPPTGSVERLRLELDGTAPAAGQQLGLFTPQLARAAQLDWQLAGLAIRFGPDRLLQARCWTPRRPSRRTASRGPRPGHRIGACAMTRLLGQLPVIGVETDALGQPAELRWPGVREPVEVCNHWRVEEAWWRRPLLRDYYKVVGPRLLALIYRDGVDGSWHLERLYD